MLTRCTNSVGNSTAVVSLLTTSMECSDISMFTSTEKYSVIWKEIDNFTIWLFKGCHTEANGKISKIICNSSQAKGFYWKKSFFRIETCGGGFVSSTLFIMSLSFKNGPGYISQDPEIIELSAKRWKLDTSASTSGPRQSLDGKK